jgi:DnaJ-class molecular chaperone
MRVALVSAIPCRDSLLVQVFVESNTVTKPFEVKRIEKEGMPVHNVPSERGTLHVKIEVDFPASLTQDQKDLVAKLFSK